MKDTSEDEQEEDFMASTSAKARKSNTKFERAEQLRKMMEDEGRTMGA